MKIPPKLIKKHMFVRAGSSRKLSLKKNRFKTRVKKPVLSSKDARLYKAICLQFAGSKRKALLDAKSAVNPGTDLKEVMQEAKSAYESIREVQAQLNQAYRDLQGPK